MFHVFLVGSAIVIWCKFLEPYVKPIYDRLCQYYPPLRSVGDQTGVWAGKIEKFGKKIGIRMPQSCPMLEENNRNKNDSSKVTQSFHGKIQHTFYSYYLRTRPAVQRANCIQM